MYQLSVFRRASPLALLAGAALCRDWLVPALADPPAAPTPVELTVVGGVELNPSAQGRPSPVVVRIFELAAARSFQAADFAALFEHPDAALKSDLLAQEEFMLRPGDIQLHNRDLGPRAEALGVAAAFRDLGQVWHLIVPVTPGRRNLILVDLDRNTIRVVDQGPK